MDQNKSMFEKWRKLIIVTFFSLHLIAIGVPQLLPTYRSFAGIKVTWNMFAPEPEYKSNWLAVKKVIAWEKGKPVYDPQPLYQSYKNEISDHLVENSNSYDRDVNMNKYFRSPGWQPALIYFTLYWAKKAYKEDPSILAVHTIRTQIPSFSQRLPASPIREKVIWNVSFQ